MIPENFTQDDFKMMQIAGLDNRMDGIKKRIQPKFRQFADQLLPYLTEQSGTPFYAHIARHARRTVNPPDSTWVAFSADRRSYKKYPHFQLGLWKSHLFFWMAVIEEFPAKPQLADYLLTHQDGLMKMIPGYYNWSENHMSPAVLTQQCLSEQDMSQLFYRLQSVKKAEILCGITFSCTQAETMSGKKTVEEIKKAVDVLLPFYKAACRLGAGLND